MSLTKKFEGKVSRLLVCQKCRLILLEVLILNGDVVQSDDHHRLARLVRSRLALLSRLGLLSE